MCFLFDFVLFVFSWGFLWGRMLGSCQGCWTSCNLFTWFAGCQRSSFPLRKKTKERWRRRGQSLYLKKPHVHTHWHHQSKSAPFNQKLINIHILWEKSVRISNTTKAARWGSLRKYRREYKNEMNIWTSKQMPNWTWYNMTRPKAEQVLNAAVLWKITS